MCVEKSVFDGDDTFFTNDSGNSYYSCSLFNKAKKYLQCSNKETCSVCQEGYDLVNDNTLCILQEDVKNNLIYYDRDLNRYIPCSELIPKWYKCISKKICEKCEDNLTLVDNDKCVQKEEEENSDKSLSTGAIIGIVVGCIVFLVIFIGLIFFLVKKIIKRYDALKNP